MVAGDLVARFNETGRRIDASRHRSVARGQRVRKLQLIEPIANHMALVPNYLRSFAGREPLDGEVEAFRRYVEAIGV